MVLNKIKKLLLLFFFLSLSANAKELKSISWQQFIDQNPSVERKQIVDFLIHQFDRKKEAGVTQRKLDELWENKPLREKYMMARFQIIDQKLYADSYYIGHYYFPILLQYFQKLIDTYKINDVDFIIYLREEIPMNESLGKETMGTPAFIMFQDLNSEYETDKLLFPDAFFMKENKNASWIKLTTNIQKANLNNPWDKKINKIFWRGNTTGDFYPYTIENFSKLPRLTLSVLSKLYPNLIDSELSYYSPQITYEHYGPNLLKFCKMLFTKKPKGIKEVEHLKYKYLASLDGNAATGTRVAWIMLSNSVLVKQESKKIQWYYSALKAYFNYVPLKHDLTDIFKQINWMKEHDDKLEKISSNAQNFGRNNLLPEHIDAHITLLLNEYSHLQKDKKIIPSLTKAEDVISPTSAIGMFLYKIKLYLLERVETWF